MASAERGFKIRIRRALKLTLEPLFEAIQYDLNVNPDLILKPFHIEQALRWLYVEWGYKQALWFSRNFEYQKKNEVWALKLENWFNTEGAKKVTAILGTTKELIKPVLVDAIKWAEEGQSIDEISASIKTQVNKAGGVMSEGRATTIARTEVIGAANVATHQVASDIGDNLEKRWVTGGANVRATHIEAERMGWIPFNEPFIVGDYRMQHPGDPNGGAEEVINCKCVEVYRTIT